MRVFSGVRHGVGALAAAGLASTAGLWLTQTEPPWIAFVWMADAVGIAAYLALLLMALHRMRREVDQQADRLDLAERNLAEARTQAAADANRLTQSLQAYDALLSAQTDVMLTRSGDSRLTYGNPIFFQRFALDPIKSIGLPFAPELHPESRQAVSGHFAELESGQDCIRCDQRIRTTDGWRWFSWQDRFLRDDQGRLTAIQSIGRDIEADKAREDALQKACAKATAENKAKTDILSAVSREIRTSVNNMTGVARLLLETDLTAEQHSYTMSLLQSGEYLANLTGDVLDATKIEAGTLVMAEEKTRLQPLIEEVAERFGPRAHAKGIELVAVTASNVPQSIRIDARRIRQILTNLLGMAIGNTDEGGVRLDIEREVNGVEGPLVVRISSSSPILPEGKLREIQKALEEPMTHDKRAYTGTSLGLSVSKRLVQAMGGEIGFRQTEEAGNLFWCKLPVLGAEPAPLPTTPLSDISIAVISTNRVLRRGLISQIHLAGGEAASLTLEGLRASNILLVDAGTGAEPHPLIEPVPVIPTVVLLPPAARPQLPSLRERGFAGYLIKPVRIGSLIERVKVCDGLGVHLRSAKVLSRGLQ